MVINIICFNTLLWKKKKENERKYKYARAQTHANIIENLRAYLITSAKCTCHFAVQTINCDEILCDNNDDNDNDYDDDDYKNNGNVGNGNTQR